MVTIILNKSNNYNDFNVISVHYTYSRVFKKNTHILKTPSLGKIEVCKDDKSCKNQKLTFNRGDAYTNKKLKSADVYFNAYDTSYIYPLLMVLFFENLDKQKNRIYKLSDIDNDLGHSQDLFVFKEHTNEKDLLTLLFEENYKLKDLLTYDIERKQADNGHTPDGKYDNRISVEDYSQNQPKLTEKGFKLYKHSPKRTGRAKKGCLLYNKGPLFQYNGLILYNIQVKPNGHVNVYWSAKADLIVLLEIVHDHQTKNDVEFYCHNAGSRLFWEKLNDKNFDKYTGYKITNRDNIYQKLTDHDNSSLFKLLGKLESNLLKILFLLVNKRNGNYGDADVKWTLGNYPRLLESKNRVSVIDILNRSEGNCLRNSEFSIYEHDFESVVDSFPSEQQLKLKFIRSSVETFSTDNSIIQLDKKISTFYMYGSHQITLSYTYNIEHSYKWYRHSCFYKIFSGLFKIKFKGEILRLNGDLSDQDITNKIVTVYFKTGYSDRFVLLLFPSTDQNKIRYLTYEEFKKGVSNGTEIKLSTLTPATVSVMNVDEDDGSGFKIDEDLVQLLNDEYEKNYSLAIQVYKKNNDIYRSGTIEITVNEKNNTPKDGYKCVEHTFNILDTPFEIVFHRNHVLNFLDITKEFRNKKITSVSIYFRNDDEKTPLIICITTDKQINRCFKYAEFIYNARDTVKLSDLEEIKEPDIQSNIDKQYSDLLEDVTLDIFSTKNYSGFDVSPLNSYGNYKYYTHTLTRFFKKIQLKETGLYELTGFRDLNYTHQNPLNVSVFYHAFDKNNLHPLIIEIYTTVRTTENEISHNTSFYQLNSINNKTFEKNYQKVHIGTENFTNTLDITYNKFRKKIDNDLKIHELDYTDYILYSGSKNKLYVYFHKSDPRPLAFCYGNQAYKRYFLGERDSKWIQVPNVRTCICTQDNYDSTLSSLLKELSEALCLVIPNPSQKIEERCVIDLSKTDTTYGLSQNLTVSTKKQYYHCNLFHYCTHSLTTHSTFTMTSLKTSISQSGGVGIDQPLANVKSVRVYFNKNSNDKPVLLEVIFDNGIKKYLKDLEKEKNKYSDSDFIDIKNEPELVNDLIKESDRINNRTTFQIDQKATYNGIVVQSKPDYDKGYTSYTHPKGVTTKHIDVLYNRNLLVGRRNNRIELLNEIEGKISKNIDVYCLDVNDKLPILVFLNGSVSSYNTCVLNRDQSGLYWKLDQLRNQNSQSIRDKLDETYYFLGKSVVIELDEQNKSDTSCTYDVRLIDNMVGSDGKTHKFFQYRDSKKSDPVKNILVTDVTNSFGSLNGTSFKCYEHDLSELKGSPESTNIGGLRFYIKIPGSSSPNEIRLYDNSSKKNRLFLYYNPNEKVSISSSESNKIKVFFHKNDPRPFLISCKGKGYKRVTGDNHIDWYNDSSINISISNPLTTLKNIYKGTKKKFRFLKDGNINDNVNTRSQVVGSFNKLSYSANDQPSITDGNFQISKSSLNTGITDDSIIATLFEILYNKYFDSINVYRKSDSSSLKDFFVFEFINESSKTHFQRVDKEGKYWVNEFISYKQESELYEKLPNIQTNIDQSLLYEIENTQTNHSYGITVTPESDDSIGKYTKYKHTPVKDGHKKSLFYCNKQKLMKKFGHEYKQITELETHIYVSVMVYFAANAKKSGSSESLPLMIEFTKKSIPTDPDYYVHKRNGTYYYWEKLAGNFFKNLLIQMGFGITQSDPGYNQLKVILHNVSITLGPKETDYSNKISGIKSNQLKRLMEQKVGDGESQKPTLLKLLLQKIDFELVDSIVILLNKKVIDNQYDDGEVHNAISNLHPKKEINRLTMSEGKNIRVTDATGRKGQCIQPYGYKVVCHDLTNLINGLGEHAKFSPGIRFVIPTKTRGMYRLITFYNCDKTEPQYVEYIYHTMEKNEIYVYFYGDDPRPLLICYKNVAYRPKDKDSYTSLWVKDSKITNCLCQDNPQNIQLLSSLTEIIAFLNPVELSITKLPSPANITMASKAPNSAIYILYKYTTGVIIKIRISSEILTCYYKYTYEPVGMGNDGEGFRLGNVFYSSEIAKNVSVGYITNLQENFVPVLKVFSYFYIHDMKRENPLLVEVLFKDGKKEYYKLTSNSSNYTWKLLDSKSVDGVKLYDELYKLNSQFNGTNSQSPKQDDCIPSDNTTTVASSTVTTVAVASGVGGGVLYYKYPGLVLSLISKMIPK